MIDRTRPEHLSFSSSWLHGIWPCMECQLRFALVVDETQRHEGLRVSQSCFMIWDMGPGFFMFL
jgi:hypothetical protein